MKERKQQELPQEVLKDYFKFIEIKMTKILCSPISHTSHSQTFCRYLQDGLKQIQIAIFIKTNCLVIQEQFAHPQCCRSARHGCMCATFAFPEGPVQTVPWDNRLQEAKSQCASLLHYKTETEGHFLALQKRHIAKHTHKKRFL